VTPPGVVTAYDGSKHARRAVERAGAVLQLGPAVVVCVWLPLEQAAPAATLGAPVGLVSAGARELDMAAREQAEAVASEGAQLVRAAGFDAEARAIEGGASPWHAIVHCAEQLDASVIVTGSRGRSRVAAALLGSTAQGVLHHAGRPVLVA
jgi:nucleotide-binding universal stress UspA family protein